jgi:hypothetical protein
MNEHLVGTLSRRAFLQGLSAVGIAASLPGRALGASIGTPPGLGLESLVDVSLLPPPAAIRRYVEEMVGLGPRLSGSPAHARWIDRLEDELSAAGVAVSRDHFTFTRWSAGNWGLELLEGLGAGPSRRRSRRCAPTASAAPRRCAPPATT